MQRRTFALAATLVLAAPAFAQTYMKEKRAVLQVLQGGDATLWRRAMAIVDGYFAAGEAAK